MLKKIAVFLIQVVAGFFRALHGRACRFAPSCSVYSIQAFNQFGFLKALMLSAKRLVRCQPFSRGGYDPIK